MKKGVAVAIAMAMMVMGVAWAAEEEEENSVRFGQVMVGKTKLTYDHLMYNSCIRPGKPCGALHWCCPGLKCNGIVDGRCNLAPGCQSKYHGNCALLNPCCFPYLCDKTTSDGKCIKNPSLVDSSLTDDPIDSSLIEQVV